MARLAPDAEFVRPPDVPVFYPTEEEFTSPMAYIHSIKERAEKFGLCKIIPPKSFKPPFAVNKETFKFKARYQRLSDLDGFSRSRHSFACMLRRFWTDQGWPAELPVQSVGGKFVDWYDLYIGVLRMGGCRNTNAMADGWTYVAQFLGVDYNAHPNAPRELKLLYEKNLLPYDDFRASVELLLGKDKNFSKSAPMNKSAGCRRLKKECERDSPTIPEQESMAKEGENNAGTSGEQAGSVLQETDVSNKGTVSSPEKNEAKRQRARRSASSVCYSEVVCEVCKETDEFDNLKFCEKCESTYHHRCIPASIRREKAKLWLCPKCMKETYEGLRACHTFGFEHTLVTYTLDDFQRKANEFKKNHFGSYNVGLNIVEAEFWRILADANDETIVEYGADLHRGELGSSGFPTDNDRPFLRESEKEYIDHPWNLNKLPDDNLSILKHITVQISGMKVPWMYVGMVFSAFCWHTEDHWSASINYLHLGEPKTWYGVPGSYAEAFETAFKQQVPILAESNPDLLHQLVTHMNPMVLQRCGIPVYRADQRAGEFIVTFPRAYHAGFNQGFNFAEAVNFCLADWIPHGRLSVGHYSNCKRELVFSHDELICCMADQADALHQSVAKACHMDFTTMIQDEKTSRDQLISKGVALDDEPTLFEFMDDHERTCHTCHTTLFLSAVQCNCSDERLGCSKHVAELCVCDLTQKRLLYRYTIDDLAFLGSKLLKRSETIHPIDSKPANESFYQPKRITHDQNGRFVPKKPKVYTEESSGPTHFFTDDGMMGSSELKAVMKMATDLVSPQTMTRNRENHDGPSIAKKWKIGDVEGLVGSLLAFPGTGKEVAHVREYLRKYYALQNDIRACLLVKPEEQQLDQVKQLYDQARSTNIEIDSLQELQMIFQQTDFADKISIRITNTGCTIQSLAEVLQSVDEVYVRTTYMENLAALLTSLIDEGRNIEISAENIVSKKKKISFSEAKCLVERADAYPADLKHIDDIRDGIETTGNLLSRLDEAKAAELKIHFDDLKSILSDEDLLIFESDKIQHICKLFDRAKEFLTKLKLLFFGVSDFGTNSSTSQKLVDVLCPRKTKRREEAAKASQLTLGRGRPKDSSVSDLAKLSLKDELKLSDKLHPLDVDFASTYDFKHLKRLFERSCLDEQKFFEDKRTANCLKSAIDSDVRDECGALRRDLRWCVCGGQQLGMMIQCDSCFDWFHVSCTRIAELIYVEGVAEFGLIRQLVENIQFMCDGCQRGVRPSLELLVKLMLDYSDVQTYITVPEMDLLSLVLARADKWRRNASNIASELPSVVHKMNAVFSKQLTGEMTDKDYIISRDLRQYTRDAIVALLLEGNLLEVKVPEWMFLYDFVHENFRKEIRNVEGGREEAQRLRLMILPIRSTRVPIAIDMISPLFKELSKSFNVSSLLQPADEGMNGVSSSEVDSTFNNSNPKRGRPRKDERTVNRNWRETPTSNYSSPEPEPREFRIPGKRGRKKGGKNKKRWPSLTPPKASFNGGKHAGNGDNHMNSMPVLRMKRGRGRPPRNVSHDVKCEDERSFSSSAKSSPEAVETCSGCRVAFPADDLPSVIMNGRLVPMCDDCKSTRADRSTRNRISESAVSSDNDSLRSIITLNTRARRPRPFE